MKRRMIALFFVLMMGTMGLHALGLDIEFGGVYLNHQVYKTKMGNRLKAKNLGGGNFGLVLNMIGNFSVYATTMASTRGLFTESHSSDTQIGLSYTLNRGNGLELLLGGGFAICDAKFTEATTEKPQDRKTIKYTNIGGGVNVTAAYMFGNVFGIYVGTIYNLYSPVMQYLVHNDTIEEEIPLNLKYSLTGSNAVVLGVKIRL